MLDPYTVDHAFHIFSNRIRIQFVPLLRIQIQAKFTDPVLACWVEIINRFAALTFNHHTLIRRCTIRMTRPEK